jgi:hypothetical protein
MIKTGIFKVKSISKLLGEKLGGKWKWEYPCYWRCDDGNRYVARVATGMDFNGEYTGESQKCLYYTDNSKPPEWVYL